MQQDQSNPIHLSTGRAFFLGATSLLMSLSVFMAAFAPYPLALVASLLGRKKGYGLCIGLCAVSFILSAFVFKSFVTFVFFLFITFISVMITEIIRLRITPLKGIFIGGLILITTTFGLSYSYLKSQDLTLKGYILKSIDENKDFFDKQKAELAKSDKSAETLSLLDQPEILADSTIKELPSYLFAGSFLIIWLNLFMLIRSQRFLLKNNSSAISEFSLLFIKLPDHLIWLVIVSLAMALGGDLVSPTVVAIGSVLVSSLSVFYFFQGFGIYIHFLNYVNVRGFFRTILIVFTVLTANYILVLVGLFDMFINFRKYFVKK